MSAAQIKRVAALMKNTPNIAPSVLRYAERKAKQQALQEIVEIHIRKLNGDEVT